MSGRVRAVALGYQGFGNVGDEAILAGLESVLAGSRVRVTTVIGGPEPIPAFSGAQRIITRRMRPNLRALRALRRSRLVILSGGGLLHDHWWTVVPTYLAWVVLARLVGARVAWAGVGIGPLRGRLGRFLAGRALRLATVVTVRDDESASLAAVLAPGKKVTVVPDPALMLPAPAAGVRRGIGFIIRGPTPGNDEQSGTLSAALTAAASQLAARPATVRLLTFGGPSDRAFADGVAGRSAEAGHVLEIEELSPDPLAALDRAASLEAIVSVRLHGCILAALAGTPMVPIAYDDKVANLARRLGRAGDCLPVAGLTGSAIVAALERAETPDALAMVAERVAVLRGEGDVLRALIEGAAE